MSGVRTTADVLGLGYGGLHTSLGSAQLALGALKSRPLQAGPELLKQLGSEDMSIRGSNVSNFARWRLFIHCDVQGLS